MVMLTVTGYYSERMQIKVRNGKGTQGRVQERPGTRFQVYPLREVVQTALTSPSRSA